MLEKTPPYRLGFNSYGNMRFETTIELSEHLYNFLEGLWTDAQAFISSHSFIFGNDYLKAIAELTFSVVSSSAKPLAVTSRSNSSTPYIESVPAAVLEPRKRDFSEKTRQEIIATLDSLINEAPFDLSRLPCWIELKEKTTRLVPEAWVEFEGMLEYHYFFEASVNECKDEVNSISLNDMVQVPPPLLA